MGMNQVLISCLQNSSTVLNKLIFPLLPFLDSAFNFGDNNLSSLSSSSLSSFINDAHTPTKLCTVRSYSTMGPESLTSMPTTKKPSTPTTTINTAQSSPNAQFHTNTKSNLNLPLVSPLISHTSIQPTQAVPIKQAVSTTTLNIPATENNVGYTARISTSITRPVLNTSQSLTNLNSKTQKSTNLVHPRQSEIVSIVKPVVNDIKVSSQTLPPPTILDGMVTKPSQSKASERMNPSSKPIAALVFPEQQQANPKVDSPVNKEPQIELIPETRDRPSGFDLDDFLPKHLQDTIRLGYQPQPEMSETEAMQAILRGHKSVVTALSHRRKNLHIVLAMWNSKNGREALKEAIMMEDHSVMVDILNVITLKPLVIRLSSEFI